MFLPEWREFLSAPCLAGGKKNPPMTARVSRLLKSRAFLTCFRACYLPGRAKDLSVRRYKHNFETRSRNHCCGGRARSVTYSVCVCVCVCVV